MTRRLAHNRITKMFLEATTKKKYREVDNGQETKY